MALSHLVCQAVKPKIKSDKLTDAEGLYLEVTPHGTKFWRGPYASISVDEFPAFLDCLHKYQDQVHRQTFLALELLLLTFGRRCELVEAKWEEIQFEKAMWVIPILQ